MEDDSYSLFQEGKRDKKSNRLIVLDDKHVTVEKDDYLGEYYIFLRLPVYDIEGIKRGLRQQFLLKLRAFEVIRIKELFAQYDEIWCNTDGSSLNNPGISGAGVAFYGHNFENSGNQLKTLNDYSHDQSDPKFMFGMALHLGTCSNNYAEYSGIIIAQLMFALFKQPAARLRTDSMLVV